MAIIQGDGLALKTYCYFQGQVAITTIHYCVSSIGGAFSAQLVAQLYDTAQAAAYKALLTNSALYRGVSCQKLASNTLTYDVEGVGYSTINSGNNTTGTGAGPTQAAGILTKRTAVAGRSGRGRIYLPFVDVADMVVATGAPTTSYVNLLGAYAAIVLTPMTLVSAPNSIDLAPVVRNPGTFATLWPAINAWNAQPKFATQKRRGQYGRLNVLPF